MISLRISMPGIWFEEKRRKSQPQKNTEKIGEKMKIANKKTIKPQTRHTHAKGLC